jgi:hypothetical protein
VRPFYAVILAHFVASYAALTELILWAHWFGRGNARFIPDREDILKLVLFPILQLLLVPSYTIGLLFRFDWQILLYLLTHATVFVLTCWLLIAWHIRRRSFSELDPTTKAAIEEGLAQAERGVGRPWPEVREELRARFIRK